MTKEEPSTGTKKRPTRLAQVIRSEREKRGWTSETVSKLSGLTHQWVRNYEAGFIQSITADKIRALERSFDMRVGELYAVALGIPYDRLVQDILESAGSRRVPWEQLLDGQQDILAAIGALSRRLLSDEENPEEVDALIVRLEELRRLRDEVQAPQTDEQDRDARQPLDQSIG